MNHPSNPSIPSKILMLIALAVLLSVAVDSFRLAIAQPIAVQRRQILQKLVDEWHSPDPERAALAQQRLEELAKKYVISEEVDLLQNLWIIGEVWRANHVAESTYTLDVNLTCVEDPRLFAHLRLTSDVREVNVQAGGHTDELLMYLSGRQELISLDVQQLTSKLKSYESLDFPNLEFLRIRHSQINAAALGKLKLPNLMCLDLEGSSFGEDALKKLPVDGIRMLNLSGTKISPQGLEPISRFKDLRTVAIDINDFDPKLLETLATMEKFAWLDLCCDETERTAAEKIKADWTGKFNILIRDKTLPRRPKS